jgi:Tol biopolymer transport system component/predicted Ser/Thr protein kinase
MTPERWQQVERLYQAALEREPSQRAAFLKEACAGDEVVRQEVESLLAYEPQAETFIEAPVLQEAAQGVSADQARSLVGRQLGSFKILSLVGAGGMGEVYRARDDRLGREVAIKVLPAEVASDRDRLRRFLREARSASTLNHPNVATIHEIGEDGVHFITMEYVAGQTLAAKIQGRPLETAEIVEIAVQVADALEEAHSQGITHRDIKPANIMLKPRGQVKLLDFGLAKATQPGGQTTASDISTVAKTETGVVLGTVQYMSPEQLLGKEVDHRTDLFSLGVVLYEMATGHRPFSGACMSETIDRLLHAQPQAVARFNYNMSAELERIIIKALEKDREVRYQSAKELLVDLKRLKRDMDSGKLAVAPAARRGHRRSLIWAAALLVALAGGGIALWLTRSSGEAPEAHLNAVPLTSYPGFETDPSFSPDGNQVAFSWNGEGQDNFDIYVKLIGSGPPLRLTDHQSREFSPVWSPDGRSIAFLRELSRQKLEVLLIPALGGPERKLTEVAASPWLKGPYLAWSPDGKWLAVVDASSPESYGLFMLSPESGERLRLTAPPVQSAGDSGPAFSPDGRSLAFIRTATFAVSDLYLLPLSDSLQPIGEPKRLTFDNRDNASPAWTPEGREIIFSSGQFNNRSLWRMAVSDSAKPQQWATAGENNFCPAISRQGRRFVYSRQVGDVNIWRLDLGAHGKASAPTNLIHSTRGDTNAQFSPDGKRIAFVSDRSGNIEIWVCDSDGSNPVQLTSFGSLTVDPRWSLDSERIAFISTPENQWEVYQISANGGKPQRLTAHPASDDTASWSRDGKWIYFGSNRSGDQQVWKMPSSGGEAVQVTRKGGFDPFESLDGKVVYYEKDNGLWKVPVEGGAETRVLESINDFGNFALVEEGIYFIPAANSATDSSIQFFSFATGKIKQIARIEKPTDMGLSVSPDRRWILCSQIDQVGSDLMLVENFR